MRVYADNSTTSFPKAKGVSAAMTSFLDATPANINRGSYTAAYDVGMDVLKVRQLLCQLFSFDQPKNVVFTPGITYSLNMILKGFLQNGDHVITSSMEHNGLMRPLHDLTKNGVTYDIIQANTEGIFDSKDIAKMIKHNTKMVVMTHASNVCGTLLPITEIGKICKEYDIKFVLDSAQTAGSLSINMEYIDALCFTAHKGLLASPGLGGFLIKSDFAKLVNPIITGGTGSASHELEHPTSMPDKFETGTLNIPAIIGLKTALEYILSFKQGELSGIKMSLTSEFLRQLENIKGLRIVGKKNTTERVAVVSLDFVDRDNSDVSTILDEKFGIMTRCGLHCSPMSHKTLGTYPQGTVRFSFSHFNTMEEIDYIVRSIKWILNN
ncbi:MAG: aminotransferase class V-fold PLP-dependent enzyme [Defluviitaleaceae bacterium]|nr:aminotransferase class V-fold PLP-dependent enzyme [Defluviitaleaceae bacterium]